jgi:importin subunit beta-1
MAQPSEPSELAQVLLGAQDPDESTRNAAEAHLKSAEEGQFAQFLMALCTEFALEDRDMHGRTLAGLYLKNMVSARDEGIRAAKEARWKECDVNTKSQARAAFMQALVSPQPTIAHTAAQVVAAFGCVDIPLGESAELMGLLSSYVTADESPNATKMVALECIGYLCEKLSLLEESAVPDEVIESQTNDALNAIITGIDNPDTDVKLKAMVALNNTLPFAQSNMEREPERDVIMERLAKMAAEVSVDQELRSSAYDCLILFADMYYSFLPKYIEMLSTVTAYSVRSDDPEVGCKAIEFWTTIAEVESRLSYELEIGNIEDGELLSIMKEVNAGILPLMLDTLTKQSDDHEDEEWTLASYGATFLEEHTAAVKDDVLPIVLQYIQQNINNANWREKDAAITAFGFIMSGPNPDGLEQHMAEALPILITLAGDTSPHVVVSSLWCIGRICELRHAAIADNQMDNLVQSCLRALNDQASSSTVIEKASYALLRFAEIAERRGTSDDATNHLSAYFQHIILPLLNTASRDDLNNMHNHAAIYSCYEAASATILNCAKDQSELVGQVLQEGLRRLNVALDEQQVSNRDRRVALHGFLTPLIGNCIHKIDRVHLTDDIMDSVMVSLLEVLKVPEGATSDALCATAQVATKLDEGFKKYMEATKPHIFKSLSDTSDASSCTMAVALVGDYCRALADDISSFSDDLVQAFLNILSSDNVDKYVKPHVVACFGDIALALNDKFVRYSDHVLGILSDAAKTETSEDDEDHNDFVFSLREDILSAYASILHALVQGDSSGIQSVTPHVDAMIHYAGEWALADYTTDDILKNAIGLIGDLAKTYVEADANLGATIYQKLSTSEKIVRMMHESLSSDDPYVKENAVYAQGEIEKCNPQR